MLEITIPGVELYDNKREIFINKPPKRVKFEHSLISISKWESRWRKPFLTDDEKSDDQIIDYIRCMSLDNIDDDTLSRMTRENIIELKKYITEPKTATTFNDENKGSNREIITSEVIYYSMISYGIPFECEKWHLDRLLTLIHVCSIKAQPQRKMSPSEVMARNKALNKARREKLKSKG